MLRAKLATAVLIGTAAWPAGAYALPDETSPVVPAPQVEAPSQDLRSPDARDAALPHPAALPSPVEAPRQDLRSPDARDAALRPTAVLPSAEADHAAQAGPSVSDSFEWGDAGIGAAVMLALVGVAGGTAFLAVRRRTPGRRADGLSG